MSSISKMAQKILNTYMSHQREQGFDTATPQIQCLLQVPFGGDCCLEYYSTGDMEFVVRRWVYESHDECQVFTEPSDFQDSEPEDIAMEIARLILNIGHAELEEVISA